MKRKGTPAGADGRPRRHRKDPERSAPIRDWANLYRKPEAREANTEASAEDEPGAAAAGAIDEAVAHGVELGYRVIDEHIRQGRRAASRFNNRSYGSAGARYGSEAAAEDLQELVERLLRYSAGLVPQWLELANALAAAPDLVRELVRQWESRSANGASASGGASADGGASSNGAAGHDAGARDSGPFDGAHSHPPYAGAAAAGDGAPAGGAGPIAIEVVSSRAARVTLDLRGRHSGRLALLAGGLRANDHERPPLSDVAFVAGDNGDGPAVRIRIPDEQPADVYMGVVVDASSGEPCGTLSVRISAG